MALGHPDVLVGCWTSQDAPTGCTVVIPPEGTLGAMAVRGSSPGTRGAAELSDRGKLTVCHGVVLSGGSAYGLAAADGVMRWLEERGLGYPVGAGVVPIVGAAIVLDQGTAVRAARPGAAAGFAACEAATEAYPPEGSVGAGTGCTVAKVGGLAYAWRGGQGVAVARAAGVTVGALVVNNAVGEIVDDDGTWIARSRAPADAPRFPYDPDAIAGAPSAAGDHGGAAEGAPPAATEAAPPTASTNTVVGCVVTDARLTKAQAARVADLAHNGIVRAVRPAHTTFDGDALFCLATGTVDAHIDLVAALAADVVATACRRGVLAARTHGGVPAVNG